MPDLIISFLKLSRVLGGSMHLFKSLEEEAIYNMVGCRSRRAELGGRSVSVEPGLFTCGKGSGGVLDLGGDDEEQLVGISSAS